MKATGIVRRIDARVIIRQKPTSRIMHKSVKNGQLKKTPSYGRIKIP